MSAETLPSILFVDDEPSILSALRRLLRPLPYRVLTAEGGVEALALLEREPVDLVVSDMRMPGMDGATFLEQVCQRWPTVQRLLLTGYADMDATIAAVNRGEIHRYVAKPWEDQDLLLALRDALSRRQLAEENRRLLALTQEQNDALQRVNGQLEQRVRERTAELEQVNGMLEKAYAQLQDNFMLSLDVFAGLLELRDRGSAGHSREVARLAQGLAQELGLPPRDQQDLFAAGLLHEIGKISLPDSLLRKPFSVMNAEEQAQFRRHPQVAEAALMPLAALQRSARLVRAQLERLDGKGVPDGLQGEGFGLAAQALALAVEYRGLLGGRLSSRPHTPEQAQALIAGGAGSRYSVTVVQAFRELMARMREVPPEDLCIDASALRAGMVLSRDLMSERGTLLLARGFHFDAQSVRKIHDYVARQGLRLRLQVQPADAETRPVARAER